MIRRYEASDLNSAARLFCRTFAAAPWNEEWSYELAEKRVRELMSAPQSVGFVSTDNGSVNGLLIGRKLTYLNGTEYVIDEFCVSPDLQRKGIGTAVLSYAVSELSGEGVIAMALMTTCGYPSERFYIKNGFEGKDDMVFMYRKLNDKECSNDKT